MRAAILVVPFLACVACVAPARVALPVATPLPARAAIIAPREAELHLDIVELSCHSCAGQVAEGTARIPGVLHVSPEMSDHMLIVKYDPARLTEAALTVAIDKVVEAIAD